MSAWVIALGLSAGYLINKNLKMTEKIEQMAKVHHDQAKPANPGPETETIRQVQRTVPVGDKYQDMNLQDLGTKDVQSLTKSAQRIPEEVARFEQGPPPIEGVWLNPFDRGF